MLTLNDIKSTKRDTPERILIHGQHKIGKSTWARNAPSPIFIPTEDGQDNIDAQAFPLCTSCDMVMEAVTVLYKEQHEFKTVVLDSADWAEKLAQKKIASDFNVKTVAEISYGRGYERTCDLYRTLLMGLNALRMERGMRIILISHSEIKTFHDPLADSYDRYQIKLHKLVNKMVQEWCDVIGFAQLDTSFVEQELGGFGNKKRTRAEDYGRRVIRFEPSAAYDAGNRYGLPATLELEWDSYEQALKQAKEKDNG